MCAWLTVVDHRLPCRRFCGHPRFSGGCCQVSHWMSLLLDQSASVEMKPSDLLPAGYTSHCQHSGSPEGKGDHSISQSKTQTSLSRPFQQHAAVSLLFVRIASDSAFSPRAGRGPQPGCTGVAGTVRVSLFLAPIFSVFGISELHPCPAQRGPVSASS